MILDAFYLAFLYASSYANSCVFQSSRSSAHNSHSIPSASRQQAIIIPAGANSSTPATVRQSPSPDIVAQSLSDQTQGVIEKKMAKQPIVKTNNTAAARKAAVKERRKAGKEALRAAREKDMANAAANAAKHEQERKKLKEAAKQAAGLKRRGTKGKNGKDNESVKTGMGIIQHKAKDAAQIFAMEQAERAAYERIAEGLAGKRSPSPDNQVKGVAVKPETHTETQHSDKKSTNVEEKHIMVGENPMEADEMHLKSDEQVGSQNVVARENITNMAMKVNETLATDNAASEALMKRPLFPDYKFKNPPFDWADDVEEEISRKSESDDEGKIDGEGIAASKGKSDRHSSPENGTDATSLDTSILCEDAIEKHDARITEAVDFEEKLMIHNATGNVVVNQDNKFVKISGIEANCRDQTIDQFSITSRKMDESPENTACDTGAFVTASGEKMSCIEDVRIKNAESANLSETHPILEAEGKKNDGEKLIVKLAYRAKDRAVLSPNETPSEKSKPGPRCGINKGFDLIGAANAHEYCCSFGDSVNKVGPLGRPDSDFIAASAIIPRYIEHLESATEEQVEVSLGNEITDESPAVAEAEDAENGESDEKPIKGEDVEPLHAAGFVDAEMVVADHEVNSEDTSGGAVVTKDDGTQETIDATVHPLSSDVNATSDAAIAALGITQTFDHHDENTYEQSVKPEDDALHAGAGTTDIPPQVSIKTADVPDDSTPRDETPATAIKTVHQERAMQDRERTEKQQQQVATLLSELGWDIVMKGDDDAAEYMGLRRSKA